MHSPTAGRTGHGGPQTEQVRGANMLARTMQMELVLIIFGSKQPIITVNGGCVYALKHCGIKTSAPSDDKKEVTINS